MDLLRVISHHRARLATPIRTVQKIYSDADLENIPFSNTIFSRSRAATNRPFLLIEPISSDDKSKASARPTHNGENNGKVQAVSTPDSKADTKAGSVSSLDPKTYHKSEAISASDGSSNFKASEMQTSDTQTGNPVTKRLVQNNSEMLQLKNENRGDAGKETTELNSKDVNPLESMAEKSYATSLEAGSEKMDISSATSQAKQDGGRATSSPSIARPPVDENIVLGVALEGSKRTLPIEEEVAPSPSLAESKELTACRNGSEHPLVSKDKKDGQSTAFPSGPQSD